MSYQPTDHELKILAAWWWSKGSNRRAAFLLNLKEQTVKNALYRMRRAEAADTTVELVMRHMDEIERRKVA